jgi:hypothetical protein
MQKAKILFFENADCRKTGETEMAFSTGYNMGFNEGRTQEKRLSGKLKEGDS